LIIVIYGPPAAGKSTIARELSGRLEGARVLTSDEFRRKTYERFLREAERLAGSVPLLILCGTFYRKRWRDEVRRIAAEKGEKAMFIRLRCPLEICLKRNRERQNRVDDSAVRIIHAEFEDGGEDLSVDTGTTSTEGALEIIMRSISMRI
jgi:predicted kinase